MKKTLALAAALAACAAVAAPVGQLAWEYDKTVYDSPDAPVHFSYQCVRLKDAAARPALAEALSGYCDRIDNQAIGSLERLNKEVLETRKALKRKFTGHYDNETAVHRADTGAVSLESVFVLSYASGQPSVTSEFFNYDARTGKRLGAKDILSDRAGMASLALRCFNKKFEGMELRGGAAKVIAGKVSGGQFSLRKDGVGFSLAGFASAPLEFTVPYKDAAPFMNAAYLPY
ncbi:MAG: hypothetical protein HUK26_06510 [Duodenibacillus sp.]|nr:hypothetical protein [Duodenibacillus sp.]